MEPVGWASTNPYSASSYYATTRDTSHYPASIGSYSVRMQNNPSLAPNLEALAGAQTGNDITQSNEPSFPIIGHPNSLTGSYKFIPQNGDTMCIRIRLYLLGSTVSDTTFMSTATMLSWASFNIVLPGYPVADSGQITMTAFNIDNNDSIPTAHGNSVLYVDNLNFDNLITTGITQANETNDITVYPNPASDKLNITVAGNNNETRVKILNALGQQVILQPIFENVTTLDISQFEEGIYFVQVLSGDQLLYVKKFIFIK
jgi:hypothetical protein